ncbi:ATP-binding protein [Candidatus Margulisiibacteriota bacterium]
MISTILVFLLVFLFFCLALIFLLIRELYLLKKVLMEFAQGDFEVKQPIVFLNRPLAFMAQSISKHEHDVEGQPKSKMDYVDRETHAAILNVLDDIEYAKKELESEKIKFGLVLENLGDAVVVLDREGNIIYHNPEMLKLFGKKHLKKKAHFGALLNNINNNINIDQRLDQVIEKGHIFETEILLFPNLSNEMSIRAIMAPLVFPDSKIHGVVGVFHDVSEMRKLDRLKYDFIATISHELRTPVTVISESINLIKDSKVGNLSKEQGECVDLAERNLRRLNKLVDNVLDVVRMETGHLRFEIKKFFLDPLLTGLAKSFHNIFTKKNIELEYNVEDELPAVAADEDRTAQVVANLLNNAFKYSSTGKVILGARHVDGLVEISVRDNGQGIKPEDIEKIFNKYEQLNKGNEIDKNKGTGLGLFIAKNIVEAQGGKIWVESVYGSGSDFKFTIPIYKEG